eukprot:gene30376-39612_t
MKSIAALKKMMMIFRAACVPDIERDVRLDNDSDNSDSDEELGHTSNKKAKSSNGNNNNNKFVIREPEIYEKVMVIVIEAAAKCIRHHLEMDAVGSGSGSHAADDGEQKALLLEKHPNWKKVRGCVLSFFGSILSTISSLALQHSSSAGTGAAETVLTYLLDSLAEYIPFAAPLPRQCKKIIKILLDVWCQSPSSASDKEEKEKPSPSGKVVTAQEKAFLRLRQVALTLPSVIVEECFRAMYLRYARTCKTFSELTAANVLFMSQSIAEIFSTDPSLAYQQAFLYIRQLALHLRSAFLKKSSETTRVICSWQFLNCLRLWTRVICTMPAAEEGLGKLAFPLSQVMYGVMSLSGSVYYTPLKFHIVACLHQLAAACQQFIPTASKVFELLEHPDLISKSAPGTELPPKLSNLVSLPANSILKSKVSKWRDMVRNLCGQLEQFSEQVLSQRKAMSLLTLSASSLETFLPAGGATAYSRLMKLQTVIPYYKKDKKETDSSMEEVSSQLQSAFSQRGNLTGSSTKVGKVSNSKGQDSDQEDFEQEEEEEDDEAEGEWGEIEDVNDIPDSVQQLAWDDDL